MLEDPKKYGRWIERVIEVNDQNIVGGKRPGGKRPGANESDPAERDLLERDLPRPGMVSILVGGPTKRGVLVGMN